jgi:hypothetical protein
MNTGVPGEPQEPKQGGLDALREQLYARGTPERDLGYTDLQKHTPTPPPLSPVWQPPQQHNLAQGPFTPAPEVSLATMHTRMKRRNRIRLLLLGGGAIFFMVAAILASTYLFFGKNSISGNNITLEARGPFAVGGGEKFDFTISLTNQNVVSIDQATLIIEYPQGTQSATDEGKDMFRERKVIDSIGPGEVLNVPASAIVYGEENDEKEIRVTIEYRVEGSNATFYRDAPPLKFKISSSPITMLVEAVDTLTSGQEVEFKVTIASNSPTPLEGILIKGEYPTGWSFSSSEPKPVAGEDSWRIATLKPEEKKTITIRGLMSGKNPERKIFRFSAGVAGDRDPYALSSIFTTKTHELGLEAAFVNLEMSVNGKSGETVVLAARESALIEVTFRNTLPDTIYDAVIEVILEGNALDETSVSGGAGFYDSTKNTISWDGIGTDGLKEIIPGGSHTVTFSMNPRIPEAGFKTPQINATVNVKGKRVRESNAAQTLTGTISRTVKVETQTGIASQVFHTTGPFGNTGPVPPVAEKPTTFTIITAVTNGSNPLSDTVLEAVLPPYVTWLGKSESPVGSISYNESTRMITWKIGDMDLGKTHAAAYQVSVLPSLNQIGTVPALVLEQRSRAKDRFTGTTVRASAPDITTQLNDEQDESKQEGRVRASE